MADLESVLVVGGGGREFALIEEALNSGVSRVYSTRGEDAVNLGIEGVINKDLGENVSRVTSFAVSAEIDLVIVGPEAPLIAGIGDSLRANGIHVFGPDSDGAVFEDDKTKTHDFVDKNRLPNPPNSAPFDPDQSQAAKSHIREFGPENIYTKRVGQEGGKGAKRYSQGELDKAFAEVDAVAAKNEKLLVQGRLHGPEYSPTFILDGRGNVTATVLARDHKSLYDGGEGPNTGGMGAFAPLSLEQANIRRRMKIEQIGMTIAEGLIIDGIDYRGAIYAGLMAETDDPDSDLSILEFNVRFGDPETQVLLQTLGGHAIDYMYAAARGSGELDMSRLYLDAGRAMVSLSVCLASPGYAEGDVLKGLPIHGYDNLPEDVSIQFAGAVMVDGQPVSSGGRVLYVTKTAPTLEEARTVYNHIGRENGGVYIGNDQQVIRHDLGLAA